MKRYGVRARSISTFHPRPSRFAQPLEGLRYFGGNTTPIPLSPTDRTHANTVYDHWGQSIDSYEQSVQVSAFSSKFDAFLAGKYTMTADEMAGFKLFNGKGNCNSCHIDGRGTTLTSGQTDTSTTALVNPLFTCFGSANEGVPLNPEMLSIIRQAGSLRVHSQSIWLRLQRFGIRNFPQKWLRLRSQPERELETTCTNRRRPDAGVYGAQCSVGAATMFND